MPLDHPFDGLAVHTGFLCRVAHVPLVALKKFKEKAALERTNHFLFDLLIGPSFQRRRIAGSGQTQAGW